MTNASIPGRRLGRSDLTVSCIGLGCMGMSYAYGPTDDNESLRVLHRYVELGGNFLDTAEVYGPYENEKLLGKFLAEIPRDRVIVATKFGFKFEAATKQIIGVDSSPANIRRACDESLTRLGIETIDLLYQHRGDPEVPIEEVIGVLRGLIARLARCARSGCPKCQPDTLRRAASPPRRGAAERVYSLWTRDIEDNSTLATCRDLGVGLVAYSPLGRGFLTGAIQKDSDSASDDWRRTNPRFQADALRKNLQLAAHVRPGGQKGCTSAQLALAWVLAQGDDIIPIPGTKRVKYLEDNLGAVNVTLTKSELEETRPPLPAWRRRGRAVWGGDDESGESLNARPGFGLGTRAPSLNHEARAPRPEPRAPSPEPRHCSPPEPSRYARLPLMFRRTLASPQMGLVLVILLLGALLSVFAGSHIDVRTGQTVNNFLNSYTLIQTATDASFFAIMAVGATVVIISGGIDLSVGSIYALAGVTTAMVLRSLGLGVASRSSPRPRRVASASGCSAAPSTARSWLDSASIRSSSRWAPCGSSAASRSSRSNAESILVPPRADPVREGVARVGRIPLPGADARDVGRRRHWQPST